MSKGPVERKHKCGICGQMFTHIGIKRHEKSCGAFTTEDLVAELESNEWATLSSLGSMHGRSTSIIKTFLAGTTWEGERLMDRGRKVKRMKELENAADYNDRTKSKRARLREEGWKKCPVCEVLITLSETICLFCIDDGRTLADTPKENEFLIEEG